MLGDVVIAVKGVAAAAAGEVMCGALKAIEGTTAETRTATGAVAMTGTAGRGGEGRGDGDRWKVQCQCMSLAVDFLSTNCISNCDIVQ